jgi:hypothetical protein
MRRRKVQQTIVCLPEHCEARLACCHYDDFARNALVGDFGQQQETRCLLAYHATVVLKSNTPSPSFMRRTIRFVFYSQREPVRKGLRGLAGFCFPWPWILFDLREKGVICCERG